MSRKVIVAITGASGAIYARLLLEKLQVLQQTGQFSEAGIVFSKNAEEVWFYELGSFNKAELPFPVYGHNDYTAAFASGSARYDTMFVCPCTMGTLGRIAGGVSDNLITRAADVVLKERRKLLLLTRETPLNLIHLQNMERLTMAGAVICPAVPSFYSRPKTVSEVAATVVDRLLDLAGFQIETFRWQQ